MTVSTPEMIRRALDARLADVFTSLPGRVLGYDPGTFDRAPTAEIELVIERAVPAGEENPPHFEVLPPLTNVPILFPRGASGAFAITWPLEPGDHVNVFFATMSFSGWRKTGERTQPQDLRLHHLAHAVAIPGMSPNFKGLSQAADNALVLEGRSIKLGKNATKLIALAEACMTNFNAIKNAMTNAVVVAQDGGASLKSSFLFALSFVEVATIKTKAE